MSRKKKEKPYQRILDAIPEGRENAITQRELADLFGVREKDIRQAIQNARKDGVLVVSTNREGYFYSDQIEDVQEHYRLFSAYIRTLNTSIKPAKKFLNERKKEGKHSEHK